MNINRRVTHIITGLGDGGAEAVLYRLCTHDTTSKHTVISLMDEGKYGALLREAGIEVHCCNMPRGKITLFGLWKLWKLLRKIKPSIIQTWMYHSNIIGGLIGRLAGVSNIFWSIHHTTLDPESTKSTTILSSKLCAKLSNTIPTAIICCAQKSLEIHKDLGYENKKLIVVSNGYDLSKFTINKKEGEEIRKILNINGKWFIGMIGRFDKLKDHKNFLEALSILKNQGIEFKAILVGTGINYGNPELVGHINHFNLANEIILLGQRNDIPSIMNALDIHVLSSYSEAFPNVVAEAMACGTPSVATDVGDARLIVDDSGWIVPPKNPVELANALLNARKSMLNNHEWEKKCLDARNRIESKFSIQSMVENYKKVWGIENDR